MAGEGASFESTKRPSRSSRIPDSSTAKETAQIGATIGREFSVELLVAVSTQGETEVKEALHKLASSNLVYLRGTSESPRYVFKHALVQEAAYESMLKSRRQQLHAHIARPECNDAPANEALPPLAQESTPR